MGLPTIEVTFKQLAVSAIKRSERGIAAIIIRDDTLGETAITKDLQIQHGSGIQRLHRSQPENP